MRPRTLLFELRADPVRVVSIDKVSQAYELAERYRDFRSLVELCNDAQHGSEVRVRSFMKKYAEEFAFALYQFLVEKGTLSLRELDVSELIPLSRSAARAA
mgnify:FL=1